MAHIKGKAHRNGKIRLGKAHRKARHGPSARQIKAYHTGKAHTQGKAM
jgi:hypothetical protein